LILGSRLFTLLPFTYFGCFDDKSSFFIDLRGQDGQKVLSLATNIFGTHCIPVAMLASGSRKEALVGRRQESATAGLIPYKELLR
jgi:hypothetical protein